MIENKQSGQTILVFLMILLVGFTIGLGIYLNSLTEVGVTVKEKESETAFNKAQAGADIAIGNAGGLSADELSSYGLVGSGVTISTVGNANPDDTVTFSNIAVGAVATVNLEDEDGSVQASLDVTVSWKPSDNSECHGVLVEVLSFNDPDYVIDRSSYMGNDNGCIVDGAPNSSSADGEGYYTSGNTTITNGSKMRIRPFGSSADIKVSGISSAPQSTTYKITGTNNAGEARAIEVNKGASSLPGIFDYVLFSKADLVKNN